MLEICLIVGGVLAFTIANVIAVKHYVSGKRQRVDNKAARLTATYQPAEQDSTGHLYY